MKNVTLLMSAAFALFMNTNVNAQVFSDNFEDQNADKRWGTVQQGVSNRFDFAAKYSDEGISAPTNGGDYCLKLEVNTEADNGSDFWYLGAFPIDKVFTGSYTVSFDAYMNYDENSSGTTELGTFGVGHDVGLFDILGESFPSDGQQLVLVGDGSSSRDVRYYRDGAYLKFEDAQGLGDYTYGSASSQNASEEPYFGALGETEVSAKQWLKVSIDVVSGVSVSFKVNGVEFLSSAAPIADGDIIIGLMDFYSSVNASAYMLVDNVEVSGDALALNSSVLEGVSVFPNPIKGEVLNIEASKTANVSIVSTVGKLMYSGNAGVVSTQAWSKGVYVVVVEDAGKKATFKVIK